MSIGCTFRRRFDFILVAALLWAAMAWAHSPFSVSTTVIVGEEVSVNVTFGFNAATELMQRSELSEENVRQAQFPRVSGAYEGLPLAFADRLFAVKNGDEPLKPIKIQSMTDGLEVMFSVTYPRPPTGALEFEAKYLPHVTGLTAGTFVAGDSDGKAIVSAMISGQFPKAVVPLPEPVTASVAAESGTVSNSVASAPLTVGALTEVAPASPVRPGFGQFFHLGVEHILLGFDHLLFLLALLVGVRSLRPMLVIITCFTLAHSVTLALAAFDLVTVSSRLVEPVIAASIIVVGVENLVRRDHAGDRYWLASAFGLLHGFGFAGALRETGLGQSGSELALPLFAFNLGVEAGQLAVAALVVPVLLLLRRNDSVVRRVATFVSVVVIVISSYWLVQRVFFTS